MIKQYSFSRSILILLISFLFAVIFTGCNSTRTVRAYPHPHTINTAVPKPTITYGDPSVLNDAFTPDQLDKRPILKNYFTTAPIKSLDYAKKEKITGKVLLLVVIDEKGDVIYVETKEPVLGLNEPALETALQYKYKPGEVDGKPVKVKIYLPCSFL